ncbi:MAG: hypothetical protein H7315_07715 [Herminiimonas sp.]|nr:hypothetical protein [Herminiimonas sp.]
MRAALQVSSGNESVLTTEQALHELLRMAGKELGLSKKDAHGAAQGGVMRVDGVHVSISCFETDVQRDAIIVAKLNVPVNPASIRQLLEINLVATIALGSTIAIDCDGQAILLSLLPIFTSSHTFLANHISQMALFANTLELQIANRF